MNNFTIIEKEYIEISDKLNFNLYLMSSIVKYNLLLAEGQEITEHTLEKINLYKHVYVKNIDLFRVKSFYLKLARKIHSHNNIVPELSKVFKEVMGD